MGKHGALHRPICAGHGLRRFVAFLGALSWASAVQAGPNDAAATKLAKEAIEADYLATNFGEAERKLRSAAAMCGEALCSPRVRARILHDLAIVLIVGLGRTEEGKKTFGAALKADPALTLEKTLTTPEVAQVFLAARAGGSGDASSPGAPASSTPSAAAAGDMLHTPPLEQTPLTAVPIYVELPEGVSAAKVVVRYKAFGAPEWKTLPLRRLGVGYGGEVGCLDVGTATGELLYFVQATDAAGDVVAMSGTRTSPNKVVIRNAISGQAPHLPGARPPTQCADRADCPPGLPGCPTDMSSAQTGLDANCECESGEVCNSARTCERAADTRRPKRFQLSLNTGPDVSLVGSEVDVCGTPQRLPPAQYTCIDQDGYAYNGVPQPGGPGTGNAVNGGPHLATTRLLVGLDYMLLDSVTLGARLGYAFGVAPGRSLARLHGVARAALWLGKASFSGMKVRPFFFVAGGIAQVDDKFEVPISETDLKRGLYESQTLTAWRQSGGAFVGGGGGIAIPTGEGHRFVAEVKLQVLFPNPGVAMAPSVGYALGL